MGKLSVVAKPKITAPERVGQPNSYLHRDLSVMTHLAYSLWLPNPLWRCYLGFRDHVSPVHRGSQWETSCNVEFPGKRKRRGQHRWGNCPKVYFRSYLHRDLSVMTHLAYSLWLPNPLWRCYLAFLKEASRLKYGREESRK
jgi:hypothetical protein